MTAIAKQGGNMDQWLEAAFDYARARGAVGWLLLVTAISYLSWRIAAKIGVAVGSAARIAMARYDKLLTDWEDANRRKNEELRSKDLEIAQLREELRAARADAAA